MSNEHSVLSAKMESKIPVVLVHGNTESGEHWAVVMERLKKAGYTQVFAINFTPPANGSCVGYAGQLQTFMDTVVLPNIAPHKKVAMLAHSLGVTTTRYYIKNLGGKAHVSHAVLIAGANHGIAACDTVLLSDPQGKYFQQAPELHTDNPPFLQQLNAPGGEEGVLFMTLSGPHDFYYSMHEESPFVSGADNRVIPYKGHWDLRDSEESFVLMAAFLEGKLETQSLGKGLFKYPDRPYGQWHYCEDCTKIQRYTFLEDGTALLNDGKVERRGIYKVSTRTNPGWIDIEFPEGTYYGLYRLNANGDGLALKLSAANGLRPNDMRYPDLYYRTPTVAISLPEILGRWKAIKVGFLRSFITPEFYMSFGPEGQFKIEGKMLIGADFVVEGKFMLGAGAQAYTAHVKIEKSNLPTIPVNNHLDCIFDFKDSKLRFVFPPGTRRAYIPQVIDNPIILEKVP